MVLSFISPPFLDTPSLFGRLKRKNSLIEEQPSSSASDRPSTGVLLRIFTHANILSIYGSLLGIHRLIKYLIQNWTFEITSIHCIVVVTGLRNVAKTKLNLMLDWVSPVGQSYECI